MAYAQRLTTTRIGSWTLGVIGFAVALLIIVAGNYDVRPGENGGTVPAIVTSAVCLALTLVLFGYVVPRAANTDRTALILGIVAVVTVAGFWSGLTPVLASAAIATTARSTAQPPRRVVVVEALALLGTGLALAITLSQSHLL